MLKGIIFTGTAVAVSLCVGCIGFGAGVLTMKKVFEEENPEYNFWDMNATVGHRFKITKKES